MKNLIPKAKRILVRGLNYRLGDNLFTTPIFEAIKYIYPDSIVDLVTPKHVQRIFFSNPFINNIILLNLKSSHSHSLSRLKLAFSLKKNNYDVGITLQRSFEGALFLKLAGCKISIGYDSDYRKLFLSHPVSEKYWSMNSSKIHQVEYYLNLLRYALNIDIPSFAMRFSLLEADKLSIINKIGTDILLENKKYIVISTGTSYGKAKFWFKKNWIELINKISHSFPEYSFLFVGEDSDNAQIADIINSISSSYLNLCGMTSIGELSQLIEYSTLIISIDNGVLHLSSALGKKVIGLYGSTNPYITGPYNSGIFLFKELPCSYCLQKDCPQNTYECMKLLSVEDVYKLALKYLT